MVVNYTDFLYYDAVLDSILGLEGLQSKSIKNAKKLNEANLLISASNIFSNDEMERVDQMWTSEAEKLLSTKKNKFDIYYLTDVIYREYTNYILAKGINAIPKYSSKQFSNTFRKGNSQLLNTIFSQLPTLDPDNLNIDELIDFLKDEETQVKRRRMFSWQNDIEAKIEKGDIKIEYVPDMIAERLDTYIDHIKLSELKFKYGVFENLLMLSANIIAGLTLVGLPKAVKNLIQFKKRELELQEAEIKAPGRELAYIVHTHRQFVK